MIGQSKYRVGVVGLGRGRALAAACLQLPGANLVAVADMQPQLLAWAEKNLKGVARYDNHRSMLDRERLDVVIVATLGLHHRTVVLDAVAAGTRGVYVEKPLATSLADCDAMIEACRAAGTVLTVGHQRRWSPYYLVARDALREGAIGRVINGYLSWSSARVGSVGTHRFDALNMLIGDRVAWVSGWLDPASRPQPRWPDILDPGGIGFIVYRNGVRIAVDAMEDTRASNFDLELMGSKGQLHLLRDAGEFRYLVRDREVTPAEARQDGGDGGDAHRARPAELPGAPRGERLIPDTGGIAELLECIEHGGEPSSTGEDGRHALEVIVAFHLSSQHDMRRVQLPLTGEALQIDLKFR